jgi:hypothetical protein
MELQAFRLVLARRSRGDCFGNLINPRRRQGERLCSAACNSIRLHRSANPETMSSENARPVEERQDFWIVT